MKKERPLLLVVGMNPAYRDICDLVMASGAHHSIITLQGQDIVRLYVIEKEITGIEDIKKFMEKFIEGRKNEKKNHC